MLNNIGLPGLLLIFFVFVPFIFVFVRALWRVGSKK